VTTHPTPDAPRVPTAAEALAEAWRIVQFPERCSDMNIRRAEVCLGIARELREEAQYRRAAALFDASPAIANAGAYTRPPEVIDTAKLEALAKRFRAGADPVTPTAAAKLDLGQRIEDDPAMTAWIDPSATQRMPVVWTVGDKSQCRHCHTPIELCEAATTGLAADNVKLWRHKYTGQAACAVPAMLQADYELPASHTFAEPEPQADIR